MSPWKSPPPPKDDKGYFEMMTTHIFSAGLNWRVVENKKAGFNRAFEGFAPAKVSKYTEKEVKKLMGDAGIVRNEKKIRATVQNAKSFLKVSDEFGSFKAYLGHFGKSEEELQDDLQKRFRHMGPSTTRMFLWSVGYHLTPTKEEKAWMSSHDM